MRLSSGSRGAPPPARGQADPEQTIAAYAHEAGWSGVVSALLDWLTEHWDQPERPSGRSAAAAKDFTSGRLMSWVAFDRGIRLATAYGRPADVVRWTAASDEVYEQVHQRGWDPRRQAFVQHYADEVLDSSLLRMPRWAS